MEGVKSRARLLQQGLLQGFVLSPFFFLILINDLVEELAGGGVKISAFADNLAVWHSGETVEESKRRMQGATDKVVELCEEWFISFVM